MASTAAAPQYFAPPSEEFARVSKKTYLFMLISCVLGLVGFAAAAVALGFGLQGYLWAKDERNGSGSNGSQDAALGSIQESLSELMSHITWGTAGSRGNYVSLLTSTGAELRFIDTPLAYTESGSYDADNEKNFGPALGMIAGSGAPNAAFQQRVTERFEADGFTIFAPFPVIFGQANNDDSGNLINLDYIFPGMASYGLVSGGQIPIPP